MLYPSCTNPYNNERQVCATKEAKGGRDLSAGYRITVDRKSTYTYVGQSILEKDWDEDAARVRLEPEVLPEPIPPKTCTPSTALRAVQTSPVSLPKVSKTVSKSKSTI
ncbi:Arm DNA-binding domain-containing protein [Nostoc sp. NIES-2111]